MTAASLIERRFFWRLLHGAGSLCCGTQQTAAKGERLFDAIADALAKKLCTADLWELPWQAESVEKAGG